MVTPLARGRLLQLAPAAPVLELRDIAGDSGGLLAVIPHPDDESLAMGALLAALRAAGRPLVVVLLTDGGGSHDSARLGRPGLVRLRRRELREALRRLGGAAEVIALGHPDPGAPDRPSEAETARIAAAIRRHGLTRLITCWRGDPHVDHAAGALWSARLCRALGLPEPVEAPVWGRFVDTPPFAGQRLVRLNAPAFREAKSRAIAAHRSQMGPLVPDDPDGFVMTPETQAHFRNHAELFLLGPDHGLSLGERHE